MTCNVMISLSWSGDDLSRERPAPNSNHSEANAPRKILFLIPQRRPFQGFEGNQSLSNMTFNSSKNVPEYKDNQPNQTVTKPAKPHLLIRTTGYQAHYANIKKKNITISTSTNAHQITSLLNNFLLSSSEKLEDLVDNSTGVAASEHLTNDTLGFFSLLHG
jgi:hypothetical protein